MDESGKRRRDSSTSSDSSRKRICVVHFKDCNSKVFTYLSDTKDPDQRLKKLQEICDKRLAEPPGSVHRMTETCALIPSELNECHGYHRTCYQRFTMNLNRLQSPSTSSELPSTSSSSRQVKRSTESEHVLFRSDCIFCSREGFKAIKVKGTWTTEATSKFEFGGGKRILEVAEKREDESLLMRIRGFDFICL